MVVTNSGCHDNRMDKIWWNEQWMGWPLGPQYAASSNVDNAYRLQGKALIIVGEMDSNVDPGVVAAGGECAGEGQQAFRHAVHSGPESRRGRAGHAALSDDYFVHNLLGVEPPDWNKVALPPEVPVVSGN